MFLVMAILLGSVAIFFRFFIVVLVIDLLELGNMYKDLRIRNSNRPTPVPRSYKAYIFAFSCFDKVVHKVVLAPSLIIAHQRVKDFCAEYDVDAFFSFVAEDDFEVAYSNNVIPK